MNNHTSTDKQCCFDEWLPRVKAAVKPCPCLWHHEPEAGCTGVIYGMCASASYAIDCS